MSIQHFDNEEFHWHISLLQNLDVGLIVLDTEYRIQLWNSFMANHSGKTVADVHNQDIFKIFKDLPRAWFQRKLDTVFLLRNRAFITWQERPNLFSFKPTRPLTGRASQMYQNITLIPLSSPDGEIRHIGILIYDMTDAATSHMDLAVANDELGRLSRTDRLTNLNNRGYWEECLRREYERYSRTASNSTLILFDIDHFKKVNDTYGHQAGDEVLRKLAGLIQRYTRNSDIAGRYGGEEFAIILVETPAERAKLFAERLRVAVEDCIVDHGDLELRFTISLGIAQSSKQYKSHQEWIEAADRALYYSKEHGRNRLTVASDA